MLIKAKTLKGYKLDSKDGKIGRAKEFYFDDKHWAVRYLVADTGNWLTGIQVLISPYAMGSANNLTEEISINLSKEQIENCPSLYRDNLRMTTMVITDGQPIGAAHTCGETIPASCATAKIGNRTINTRIPGIRIYAVQMR